MNKRIRELMIKSGAFDHYEVNEGVDGDEKPMEKFAELIVKECANFLKDTLDDHFAAEQLEEHFGVEE